MKVHVFCAVLFVVASAAIARAGLKNPIDDLVRAALEYIRYELKENEPFLLPAIHPINVTDDVNKIYFTVTLSDLYASNADNFVVNDIENDVFAMWATFGVTLPSLKLDGNFEVSGTAYGKAVTGSGVFSLSVQDLVTNGHVQLELVDGSIQMKSLDLNYTIDGVEFTETGLVVEGMTQDELDSLFNTALLKFLQDNEAEVCQNVATAVVDEANRIMKGKSLIDIINWLKNFANPTTPASVN